MPTDFISFPKIGRLSRDIVITEKLDGTNAQVCITDDGEMLFGSRNRWITPDDDNHGFARWGSEHREELVQLGPGRHFGEWWGAGIQRRYGLKEKRFSLFNAGRWSEDKRPACCHVVPVLYAGPFDASAIDETLQKLVDEGSAAAPGFMDPEGIIVFHSATRTNFKKTIKDDDAPKSLAAE